jgi:hypothetical protein
MKLSNPCELSLNIKMNRLVAELYQHLNLIFRDTMAFLDLKQT